MRLTPMLWLTPIAYAVLAMPGAASAREERGMGTVPGGEPGPCLTDEQRREIKERLDRNVSILRELGVLPEPTSTLVGSHATLDWPLRAPTIQDPGYHYIWAYVDHNPGFPSALLDFSCGNHTYDTSAGYNHGGTDYVTWPFAWKRLDEGKVEVIAAAAGTILGKDDGHPDRECVNNPSLPWNAVYVQHPDGSIAWYGHLKIGSLTSKPVGATVAKGEYLGRVASSGNSSAPHLHFEVYDSGGARNDPYQGSCNGMNATSWWASQLPYVDSALNRFATGFSFPTFPGCPAPELPNEANDFNPGDRAAFVTYFRHQQSGQTSVNTIRRPDGTVFSTWTDNPTSAYQAQTYWYRSFPSFAPSGPLGIWRYDVTHLGRTHSRHFRLSAATGSGRVPGAFLEETPVTVTKSGSDLTLSWAASCVPTDTDYEIYEGTLGAFTTHTAKVCTTGGATTATVTPDAGSTYYLVVPTDTVREGSYGWNRQGVERPIGVSFCRSQVIGGSCPRCGDFAIEATEVCDRNNLNGQTCQTQGYAEGELGCRSDCQSFDTSSCF